MEKDPDGQSEKVAVVFKGEVIRTAGLKKSPYPDIEGKIFDKLCSLLKHQVRDEVRKLATTIAEEENNEKFKATVDWLDDFMNRFSLSRKKDPSALKIKGGRRQLRSRVEKVTVNENEKSGAKKGKKGDRNRKKSAVNGSKSESDSDSADEKQSANEDGENSKEKVNSKNVKSTKDKSDIENGYSSHSEKEKLLLKKGKKMGSVSVDADEADNDTTAEFDHDAFDVESKKSAKNKKSEVENDDVVSVKSDVENNHSGGESDKLTPKKKLDSKKSKDSDIESIELSDSDNDKKLNKKGEELADDFSDAELKKSDKIKVSEDKDGENNDDKSDGNIMNKEKDAKNESNESIVENGKSPTDGTSKIQKDKISGPGVRPRIKGRGFLSRKKTEAEPEKKIISENGVEEDSPKKVSTAEDGDETKANKVDEKGKEIEDNKDEQVEKAAKFVKDKVISECSEKVTPVENGEEDKDSDMEKNSYDDSGILKKQNIDSESDIEDKKKVVSDDSDIMIVLSSENESSQEKDPLDIDENCKEDKMEVDLKEPKSESKIGKIFIRKIGLFYDDDKSSDKKKSQEKVKESKSESSEDERTRRMKKRRGSICHDSGSDERGTSNEAEDDDEDSVMSVSLSDADEPSSKQDEPDSENADSDVVVKQSKSWEDKNFVEYTKKENKYFEKNQSFLQRRLTEKVTQCTACFNQVNHLVQEEVFTHKHLGVLICKKCYKFYGKGSFQKDDEGFEEYCRWCANGGDLLLCEACMNGFCRKCIKRNLGRTAEQTAVDSEDWKCYRCDLKPLTEVRAMQRVILDGLRSSQIIKKSFSRTEGHVSNMKDKFNALKVKRKVLGLDKKEVKEETKVKTQKVKKEPIPEWFKSCASDMCELVTKCTEQVDKMENSLLNPKRDFKEAEQKTYGRFVRLAEAMSENFSTLAQKVKDESGFDKDDKSKLDDGKSNVKVEKKEVKAEKELQRKSDSSGTGSPGKKKVLRKRLRKKSKANDDSESEEETPTKLTPPKKRKKKRGSVSEEEKKSSKSSSEKSDKAEEAAKKKNSDASLDDVELSSIKKDKPNKKVGEHLSPENAEKDLSDIDIINSSQASLKALEKILDISLTEKDGDDLGDGSEDLLSGGGGGNDANISSDDAKKSKGKKKSDKKSSNESSDNDGGKKSKDKKKPTGSASEKESDNDDDDKKSKEKKKSVDSSKESPKDGKKSNGEKKASDLSDKSDDDGDDRKKSKGKKNSGKSDDSTDDEDDKKSKKSRSTDSSDDDAKKAKDKKKSPVKSKDDTKKDDTKEDDKKVSIYTTTESSNNSDKSDESVSSVETKKRKSKRKKKAVESKEEKTNKDAMKDLLSSGSDSNEKSTKRATRSRGKQSEPETTNRRSKRKRKESEESVKSKSKKGKKGSTDSTNECSDDEKSTKDSKHKKGDKKSTGNKDAKKSLLSDSSDSDKASIQESLSKKMKKKSKIKKLSVEERRELKDSLLYKPRPKSVQDSRQKKQLDENVCIKVEKLTSVMEDDLKENGFVVFQSGKSTEKSDGGDEKTKFKMDSDSSDEELSSLISKFKLRKKASTSTSQENDTDEDAASLKSDDDSKSSNEKKKKKKRKRIKRRRVIKRKEEKRGKRKKD